MMACIGIGKSLKETKDSKVLREDGQQAGSSTTFLMIESSFFERISAYMAENEWKAASEAEVDSIVEENEMKGVGSKDSPCEEKKKKKINLYMCKTQSKSQARGDRSPQAK